MSESSEKQIMLTSILENGELPCVSYYIPHLPLLWTFWQSAMGQTKMFTGSAMCYTTNHHGHWFEIEFLFELFCVVHGIPWIPAMCESIQYCSTVMQFLSGMVTCCLNSTEHWFLLLPFFAVYYSQHLWHASLLSRDIISQSASKMSKILLIRIFSTSCFRN